MAVLTASEITQQLATLPGWSYVDQSIQKQYTFAGFPAAVAFVESLVVDCENDDHHPEVTINYRRVTLTWTTHSQGGVTAKDLDGARMADRHAREQGVI
jgi:4a-hydroxytetrahydrobiopterin dehydratase